MNRTKDRTFFLAAPAGIPSAPDLVTGRTVSLRARAPVSVGPRSTVVLFLDR